MSAAGNRDYVPAAGHNRFLALYDPLTRLLGIHRAFDALIDQAAVPAGRRVLDVGCGTGTLLVQIGRRRPDLDLAGLDPDPHALARAQRKAARARVTVRLDRGMAGSLPYGGASFDRVFCSMMFHHLRRSDRPAALAEMCRVLTPDGRLAFLDFATGSHHLLGQLFHGRALSEAAHRRLLDLFASAGFVRARRAGTRKTPMGAIAFYEAIAPH